MVIDLKKKYFSIAKDKGFTDVLNYLYGLYENLPMPSAIINQDYKISEVNHKFLRFFKYERDEVIGKSILEFIVSEHKEIFCSSIKQLDNFDDISKIEFEMLDKLGNNILICFSATIANKFSENSLEIFCIMEDITLKKSCEINLESKNLEMSLLLDNMEAHAWYLKDSETYGFVNKAHADFLGYSVDYLTNRNLNEFLSKDIAEICIKGNEEVFSKKVTIHTEERAPNSKGENRLLDITKTPLIDSIGNVKYVICIASDVTDKKAVEDKLRESQNRLNSLFEGSIDAIWASKVDGTIVEANQAAADMLGCDLKELIGSNITNFYVNPKDRVLFRQEVEKNKSVKDYGIKLKRKDGKEIDCVFSSSIWANSNGEILGYIGIVHDITHIIKTTNELVDSRYLLQNIIDSLPDATFSIDNGGNVLSWNKRIEEMTGIKSEEIIGKGNHEYSIPFYRERRPGLVDLILNSEKEFDIRYDNLRREGDTIEGEAKIFNSKGEILDVWAKATTLRDASGKTIGAIESIRDITEAKSIENDLKKVYMAIDQGPGIVVITDIKGNIEYANPKFVEVTGYTAEDVLGENLRIMKSNFLPSEFYTSLWDTISSGYTWKGEFHNKKKDGNYYWEYATISPVRNEKGEITNYIKVSEDITMKKRVKKQLDENLEYFAHLVDHIRNPLAILSGFAQVEVQNEKTKGRIIRQIDRIENIITLLDKGWMDTEDTRRFLKKYE